MDAATATAFETVTLRPAEDPLLRALNAVFAATASHWEALGTEKRRRCQFVVFGAPQRDFHIVVDAHGARAVPGVHPRPHVSWSSDEASLDAAFAGGADSKRVRITGDVSALLAVVRGIGRVRC